MFNPRITVIYSWNEFSKGAKGLGKALGVKRIKARNSRYTGGANHTVINWGSSQVPDILMMVPIERIINHPNIVSPMTDKSIFFNIMKAAADPPRCPEHTTDATVASSWLKTDEFVVGRQVLNGSGGAGILFLDRNSIDNWGQCKLFTRYVKKKEEYRIHFILSNEVADAQQKVLRQTDDEGKPIDKNKIDFRIRNHSNGFIFARNNIEVPEDVVVQSRKAFIASGLDFGAVDVIYNEHQGKAYVLEINTAPGLEGTTLDNYAAAFRNRL